MLLVQVWLVATAALLSLLGAVISVQSLWRLLLAAWARQAGRLPVLALRVNRR